MLLYAGQFKILDFDPDGKKSQKVSRLVALDCKDETTMFIMDVFIPLFKWTNVGDVFTLTVTREPQEPKTDEYCYYMNAGKIIATNGGESLVFSFGGLLAQIEPLTCPRMDEQTTVWLNLSGL